MTKPLRCHLHLHRWRIASTADGSYRFRKCRGWGKEKAQDDPAHWAVRGGI